MTESAVSPLAGLKSRFLESCTDAEQLHIFDMSARTAQKLHRWATRYPLIRRVRAWPLALSVAAAAPYSSLEALVSTARLSLWVFTLDDLFDEERVPQRELMRRAQTYKAIARGETVSGRDSMMTALSEIRDDLKEYALFDALCDEWAGALCGTIDGMIQEYDWRVRYQHDGTSALPAYEEYVAVGRYSIGGPPHVWTALITTDDPSTPQYLDHLRPMEAYASTCIRLANDLQSFEKEIDEGKINALVLLSKALLQEGHSAEEAHRLAERRIRTDILANLQRLADLQAGACTTTRRPEAAIADIARFVCDFYRNHDYHTFTMLQATRTGERSS